MKTRQNQNADTPHTPQNDNVSEVQNTPKQLDNAPKVQSKSTAQVKAKEAYIKSQKLQKPENTADTVKTKQNYINAHQNAEIKQKPSVLTPKTRKNTSTPSSALPKTKERAENAAKECNMSIAIS